MFHLAWLRHLIGLINSRTAHSLGGKGYARLAGRENKRREEKEEENEGEREIRPRPETRQSSVRQTLEEAEK